MADDAESGGFRLPPDCKFTVSFHQLRKYQTGSGWGAPIAAIAGTRVLRRRHDYLQSCQLRPLFLPKRLDTNATCGVTGGPLGGSSRSPATANFLRQAYIGLIA
jgi:hypothetical protein